MNPKYVYGGILIAILIAVGGYFYPQIKSGFSGVSTSCSSFTTCLSDLYLTTTGGGSGSLQTDGTLKVSSTGTAVNRFNTGICYFDPAAATIAASTSVSVDCQGTSSISTTAISALAGVTLGDNVILQLSTSTASTATNLTGLRIRGVSASTTAGYITAILENVSGTTYTWPATGFGTASGTASYFVSH